MPISYQRDPCDATRFIGLYRQDWETEWLVVKRLGLPYAFNSAEGAEAFAARRLEADEKAIPTAHKLFGDLLGLWIAGFVRKGSKRPPVHRLLARFVIEQFVSDEPFGLPTGRLDERVHLVPVEMRWPLQFWLLTQATLLLRSELAAVYDGLLLSRMATALAKIEGSSKWGNFKLGPKIDLCLRQTVAMQDEWKAKPFTSEPGYGSPAWCAANAYLTLEASSPYFRLREIPGDDVFDEVVCAFAGLEDEVSPILRHFARVCQEGLDYVQQR